MLALPAASLAATFNVNTTADNPPSSNECAGVAGDCSLRQAIDAANKTTTNDTINLPAGDYHLTIPGADEINDATGDLDVNKGAGTLTIAGAGARTTTIDATGLGDRVLQIVAGSLSMSGVTITGGAAPTDEQGGGILNSGGTLALTDSTVTRNTSSNSQGGGIANPTASQTSPTLSLIRDTIANNTAGSHGGAVDIDDGSALIENTTMTGNTSGGDGGAVDIDTSLTVQFTNDTIDANTASGDGGGVWVEGSNVQFVNTIVAGNTASSASSADCLGGSSATDQGHNLDSTGTCFTPTSTNGDLNANPKLGPLQDNGGPTDTQALLDGSPAINAGANAACPATDQRGVARPQPAGGICDIGAYEATPPAATTTAASGVTTTAATVNGTVNPENLATTYHFEYGTTTSYGQTTATVSAGAGNAAISVLAKLSGLKPNTLYHYRIVATNAVGTTVGADRTFRTKKPPFKGAYAPRQSDRVSSGSTHVRVICPKGTHGSCKGTLVLRSGSHTVIASVRISIGSGKSARVKIHLTATGQSLLGRTGRLRVAAIVSSHDAFNTHRRRVGTVILLGPAVSPAFTG